MMASSSGSRALLIFLLAGGLSACGSPPAAQAPQDSVRQSAAAEPEAPAPALAPIPSGPLPQVQPFTTVGGDILFLSLTPYGFKSIDRLRFTPGTPSITRNARTDGQDPFLAGADGRRLFYRLLADSTRFDSVQADRQVRNSIAYGNGNEETGVVKWKHKLSPWQRLPQARPGLFELLLPDEEALNRDILQEDEPKTGGTEAMYAVPSRLWVRFRFFKGGRAVQERRVEYVLPMAC